MPRLCGVLTCVKVVMEGTLTVPAQAVAKCAGILKKYAQIQVGLSSLFSFLSDGFWLGLFGSLHFVLSFFLSFVRSFIHSFIHFSLSQIKLHLHFMLV